MNSTPPQRLTRSSTDKYVGGVSGGLGHYFGIDPTVVRAGFVFTTVITGGAALVGYIAMMAFVPKDDAVPTMHGAMA
jgi:phage shock protein C